MAKLKEIKESSPVWMTTSFIDMVSLIDKSKTNKYVKMISNLVEKYMNERISNWDHYDVEHMRETLNLWGIDTTNLSNFECFYYRSILDMVQNSDRDILVEFMNLHENNSFKGIDVNQIKSIEEIAGLVSILTLNTIDSRYAKQTHIDFENDEWLIMRPLTAESSFKYGAATKWCTTSRNNPDHFFRYTEDSALIYCLNKLTGYKVACLIKISSNRNISFWNSIDEHVDSINTELSSEIFELIKKIYLDPELKSNKELGGEHWMNSHDKHRMDHTTDEAVLVERPPHIHRTELAEVVNVEEEPENYPNEYIPTFE